MTSAEKDAKIAELEAQLVAMDRIVSGRQAVVNSVEESALLLAPFIHAQNVFEHGNNLGFVPSAIGIENQQLMLYSNPLGGNPVSPVQITHLRPRRVVFTERSRLIIAVVNPQK